MGGIRIAKRSDGEHLETNEDGISSPHKGYATLVCPKCGADYLISNEMRHKARSCRRAKCGD
ncbi:hypothetical protein LCGC14_2273590 [marine sediment metagenome]|uniref:Uncharacterized protein n=1 Tax=marine sediment metagenome TaxID=412755 RepID=A0A0F9FRC6_9ZZZZ